MSHAHKLATLLNELDDGALMKGRTVKEVIRALIRTIPKAGDRMRAREEVDGIALDAEDLGATSPEHPFKLTVIEDRVYVYPGTLNGHMVTLSGTRLDDSDRPYFTVLGIGAKRVYLKVTCEPTFLDGFLMSVANIEGEVILSGVTPSDGPGEGTFHVEIGTVEQGLVLAQNVTTSLFASFCDAGAETMSMTLSQA